MKAPGGGACGHLAAYPSHAARRISEISARNGPRPAMDNKQRCGMRWCLFRTGTDVLRQRQLVYGKANTVPETNAACVAAPRILNGTALSDHGAQEPGR